MTVSHGDANVQRGTWNSDAIAMILIVSRRRQSEVESPAVPESFRSRANFPSRRGVGYNDFDTASGIVCGAEEPPAGDVLQHPEASFAPGCDPL